MNNLDKDISNLINSLPVSRNRVVIKMRFGLARRRPHTLEQIGQNFGITRERVRQIEVDSLERMRDEKRIESLLPAFKKLNECFKDCGEVTLEEHLVNHLGSSRESALFLLALGEPYISRPANVEYLSHWGSDSNSLKKADGVIKKFLEFFKDSKKPVSRINLLARAPKGVSEKALVSYFGITKLIDSNPFDEFGLASWSEIKPKGVRDKAYIVLKRESRPLHFREVCDYINSIDFGDGKVSQPQTVHNELIKDPRFSWVERGVYALSNNE